MFQIVPGAALLDRNVEFVERKGRGHPDSLADALAELISYAYAHYCLENFGAVLHHYVDKLVVLGGEARVSFGRYEQVSPIRVLLNGRFSRSFGNVAVPITDIAREAIAAYLPLVFPLVEDHNWQLLDSTNPATGSSAKGWRWLAPRDLSDLPDLSVRRANDTSISVASAPHSSLESAVLAAEHVIFERMCQPLRCGADIKILASRVGGDIQVTACVPALATGHGNRTEYDETKQQARSLLMEVFGDVAGAGSIAIDVNTRDDVASGDLYLLGLGTAAEHGDEGVVGRGNRANGLITTETPMSLDAPWGKNPVYFTGHVFDTCARAISGRLWSELSVPNSTYLAAQNGRPLKDPWRAVVRTAGAIEAPAEVIGGLAEQAFHDSLSLEAQLAEIQTRYPHVPTVKLP